MEFLQAAQATDLAPNSVPVQSPLIAEVKVKSGPLNLEFSQIRLTCVDEARGRRAYLTSSSQLLWCRFWCDLLLNALRVGVTEPAAGLESTTDAATGVDWIGARLQLGIPQLSRFLILRPCEILGGPCFPTRASKSEGNARKQDAREKHFNIGS